ncbi:CNH domain-domain-containing protein [Phakopsora pachyrhizi]|uniref:CNH domain-domain-containing protein n=1 Tax=Phakopsora pachyrhizi TaxID=170000 RepID=A0AAV0BJM6_PHAPC|nr:CNH domain-domain-containing protein [Phakopsora pachyrhizi]
MPTQPRANPNNYDRSFSFTTNPSSATLRQSTQPSSSRSPIVYPALLSRVAEAFRNRINLSERTKDGLSYNECFDGREAVDKIAYIIKTTDRNLALLLGRALDSQKFFHDVTYDHRLRDSPNELYQFRRRLASAFSGSTPGTHQQQTVPSSIQPRTLRSQRPISHDSSEPYGDEDGAHEEEELEEDLEDEEEIALPCGVFTLLTDCYSPTCTRDRLCYSIACPRRLEQQARLNLKPKPGLNRKISTESLGDLKEPGTLWIHSVPQEVVDSVSDTEKKRQEAINECIYTERDFVRDLEYLRDVWIKPLQTTNIVAEHRRQDFVTQVFWNVLEVLSVNSRLCELLFKRQKSSHIVSRIGDIYLELVPHFSPFVKYGAHQLYGKYEFEKEKSSNPAFAKFVDETERLPESRKLELNAYLTKPTTRLARYPLLLEVVLKYTSEGHSDKTEIPKAVKMIRELLTKVNIETGKSENRFNLAQLDQQLVFRQGEAVDLRLREEGRELIYKGQLKKRGGSGSDSAELQVFLFDHAVLMVKHKQSSKSDNLKVYRKPIPLELLTITGILSPEDPSPGANKGSVPGRRSLMTRTSTGNKSGSSTNSGSPSGTNATNPASSKAGFPITWNHLGRKGYSIVLWAPTWQSRQKWLDKIEARQAEIRGRNTIFEMVSLNEGFFVGANKVTCATPYDNGNRLVFGTESGVYLGMALDSSRPPVRVIQVMNVTQVDLIEEHGILLVLADKAVMTFWLDQLDPNDAIGAAKRAKKISSNASFFRVGDCSGRKLVCVVKSGSVSSTIKTLEPVDNHGGVQTNPLRGRSRTSLRKIVPGNNEALKVYKEFYIPTESSSVHFLKSKLCIGCQKGFEIVDLETLDTQGLLDPADQSLEFIHRRESTVRPISIYRVEGEFLLCYEDFAFYVNKNGWRAKSGWIIQWEGHPTAFALHYPFVLAFEPSFIEVRHVESGSLAQIIPGPNIRHLFSESPPSTSAPILAAAARQGNYANRLPPIAGHGRPSTATSISAGLPSFRTQIIFAAESKILQLRLKATNQQQHLSLSSSSSSSTYFGSGTLPSPSAPFNQVQPHQHSHPQSYPQYASNHNHHQFLSHHPSAPTHPSLQQQQLHHTHPHQAPNHHQINPIISNQQYPLNQSSNSNSSDFSPSPYYIHHQ